MNINKTRARKRDSSSERSASVTAPDKKKEKPEKRKCNIVWQLAPRRTPYPLCL